MLADGVDVAAVAQALDFPSAWSAAQEQGHVGELGGGCVGAACVAMRQARYLFGERPTVTLPVPAHEATRP